MRVIPSQEDNPHSDTTKSLQLGCPFEPRSWDLQSTRLGFYCIEFYFMGFSPILLDDLSTNSLFNPLVSGSAKLSLDFT